MGLKTAKYKAHQRVLYLFVFYLQKNKCVKWGAVLLSEGNEEGSVGAGFLEPWTSQKLFCRAKVLIWGTLISVANLFPHFQYIQIHYEAVLGIFFYFLYCSTVCLFFIHAQYHCFNQRSFMGCFNSDRTSFPILLF